MSAYPQEQLDRIDPSSYSNGAWIKTVQFHVDMAPDFARTDFFVKLDLKAVVQQDGAKILSLDMNGQTVESVELIDKIEGVPANTRVKFEADVEKCPLGSRFVITLPTNKDYKKDDEVFFRITYTTSNQASAAQFLPKESTKSSLYPFLYTQCQAIHCRSLLLIQDCCSSKANYTAKIRVAKSDGPLVALMSANPIGAKEENDCNVFSFEQPIPIPPYLFALSIGEISKEQVSERCNVYAEPAEIKIAAREYEDMEISLKAIEEMCGPYRWGTYSVLSLPVGFPFGGMENPGVSYMSGSLLPLPRQNLIKQTSCGSQCRHFDDGEKLGLATSVAIHEQVHSWSGNLVTNSNWEDFFLNEGLTVFIEWSTQRKLRGAAYESLHRLIGWEDLKDSIKMYDEMGLPQYTQLVVDLKGDVDPDDVFSSVPYMKGSAFFIYLEDIMGGPDRFQPFLKFYFDSFAWKTVNSQQLKQFYLDYCNKNGFTERLGEIDWDTWFNKPGLPPVRPAVDMTLANAIFALAEQVTAATIDVDAIKSNPEFNVKDWSSTQQTVLLDKIHSIFDDRFEAAADDAAKVVIQQYFATQTLPTIKSLLDFGISPNCELFSRWLHLWVKAGAKPDFVLCNQADKDITLLESLTFLLNSAGRMKFVRPTIRVMLKSAQFQSLTAGVFEQVRTQYHIICSTMVEKDVKAAAKTIY